MSEDKPVHIRRESYPEVIYPTAVVSVAAPSAEGPANPAIHLRVYWNVVLARKWVILAALVTTFVGTMIFTMRQTPIYAAETTVQIDRENQNILSFKDVYEIGTQQDDTLQTQYKVIASRALARRVVEKLKLDRAPEFAPGKPGILASIRRGILGFLPKPPEVSTAASREADTLRSYVDMYLGRLRVVPITRTRLVKVYFESKDPKLAALIINEHTKQFIEQNLQFKFDATTQASDFLSDQINGLKITLENSEDRLQDYSRQNQILFTEEGKNTATEKLQQLEQEFTRVQASRIEKEALVRQIALGDSDSLPQLFSNPLIAQLSAQAAELRRQEANQAVTFAPDYPSRLRLRSQIDGLLGDIETEKARVVMAVKGDFNTATERQNLLSAELQRQRVLVNNINQDIIQYNILKREVESNKQLYDGLLTRLKEAGVSAGLRASNIRVVDKAEIPTSPSRPDKSLNAMLSVFVGLTFGIGFAFLQEYLDNTIKTPDDVQRMLGVPTLAVVPSMASTTGRRGYRYGYGHTYGGGQAAGAGSRPELAAGEEAAQAESEETEAKPKVDLIMHTSPTSLLAEAYRSLRTSVLLSAVDHPPRSVLVTSAVPSEGKTATAMNLAVSFTQSGARTLLIDGDMRKPRIHTALKLGNAAGLSSFLTGAAKLQDVIHESGVPNLFVIPCGAIPPNPGELILSERFTRMMAAVLEYFDYVVLDSPPLAHVSDGRILANTCEAAILVVKASSTPRNAAIKAAESLRDSKARFAGAVLNDVDIRTRKADYSYYYSSGYFGGYGQGRKAS